MVIIIIIVMIIIIITAFITLIIILLIIKSMTMVMMVVMTLFLQPPPPSPTSILPFQYFLPTTSAELPSLLLPSSPPKFDNEVFPEINKPVVGDIKVEDKKGERKRT